MSDGYLAAIMCFSAVPPALVKLRPRSWGAGARTC